MVKKALVLTLLSVSFANFTVYSVPPEKSASNKYPLERQTHGNQPVNFEINDLLNMQKTLKENSKTPEEMLFKLELVKGQIKVIENFLKELKNQIKEQEKQSSSEEETKTDFYYEEEKDNELLPSPRRISISTMGADLAIATSLIDRIRSILNTTTQDGIEAGKMEFIKFIQNDDLGWTTKEIIIAKKPVIKESELSEYREDEAKEIYKIQFIENIQDWPNFKHLLNPILGS